MIRKAKVEDLEQIYPLYKRYALDISKVNDISYSSKIQKEGFFIDLSDKEDCKKRIRSSLIFNVLEDNKKIVGFIDINKEIYFPEEAPNIVWLNKEAKFEYFKGKNSTVLHLIAVEPRYRGKGVADELLQNSEEELKKKGYKNIFAIVTTGPLKNNPSISFHNKMGFKKVCETKPIDLFGLKDYESVLFRKTI